MTDEKLTTENNETPEERRARESVLREAEIIRKKKGYDIGPSDVRGHLSPSEFYPGDRDMGFYDDF